MSKKAAGNKHLPKITGYIIEEELGRGGMATVYLGIQEKLNRKIAIKVLSPQLQSDSKFTRRFLKEAETAANLNHSNIIPIYDVGQSGSFHYIAMEYLDVSLKERILNKEVNPQVALSIVRQMAEALSYAHNKGYVHRDIKPDNILFRADGTPVLVDFGIAKAMGSHTKLTSTGTSIGTPHYMSPEQARGKSLDGRSDIYSLGVVFYEMLTGLVPYDAEDSIAIAIKHLQDPVPSLPDSLNQYQPLLDNMLVKDENLRVQNAATLVQLINQSAEGQSITPPASTAAKQRKSKKKIRSSTRQNDLSMPAPAERPPRRKAMIAILISLLIISSAILIYYITGGEFSFTEKGIWNRAIRVHSIEKYQEYLNRFPEGTYANRAKDLLNQMQIEAGAGKPVLKDQRPQEISSTNREYKYYLEIAKNYFAQGNHKLALANANFAAERKQTDELTRLLSQINAGLAPGDENSVWGEASTTDSIPAYNSYINRFPEGQFVDSARARITVLQDEAEWQACISLNTIESYRSYTQKYPEGIYSAEAANKIKELLFQSELEDTVDTDKETERWDFIRQRNTISDYEAYLQEYPGGKYSGEAKRQIARIQRILEEMDEAEEEENDWQQTRQTNSLQAYRDYLKKYPQGIYVNEANSGIAGLSKNLETADNRQRAAENKVWQATRQRDSIEGYEDYLSQYPEGRYTAEARAKIQRLKTITSQLAERKREDQLWAETLKANRIESYSKYLNQFPKGRFNQLARQNLSQLKIAALPVLKDIELLDTPSKTDILDKTQRLIIQVSGIKSFQIDTLRLQLTVDQEGISNIMSIVSAMNIVPQGKKSEISEKLIEQILKIRFVPPKSQGKPVKLETWLVYTKISMLGTKVILQR